MCLLSLNVTGASVPLPQGPDRLDTWTTPYNKILATFTFLMPNIEKGEYELTAIVSYSGQSLKRSKKHTLGPGMISIRGAASAVRCEELIAKLLVIEVFEAILRDRCCPNPLGRPSCTSSARICITSLPS